MIYGAKPNNMKDEILTPFVDQGEEEEKEKEEKETSEEETEKETSEE
jgi:hypothetical protein